MSGEIQHWRGKSTMYGEATGFVYFIAAGEPAAAVKVGFSIHDPRRRLSALQTGNHHHLRLLAFVPGTEAMEADLHDVLRDERIRGEWFQPSKYLLRTVRHLIESAEETA